MLSGYATFRSDLGYADMLPPGLTCMSGADVCAGRRTAEAVTRLIKAKCDVDKADVRCLPLKISPSLSGSSVRLLCLCCCLSRPPSPPGDSQTLPCALS
eukprot:3940244-Rhodomonas_salina.1